MADEGADLWLTDYVCLMQTDDGADENSNIMNHNNNNTIIT